MHKQDPDNLTDLLSSMKALESRPGLEQEIFARIVQEPIPAAASKQFDWSWIRSVAAVASFVGALVLIGSFFYATQPGLFGMGSSANQSASMSTQDSAKKERLAAGAGAAAESAPAVKSAKLPALTRGLRITLKEPASMKDQAKAQQVGEMITPEDMRRIIKELFAAGAEWVSVNGVGVSEKDPVDWNDNRLTIKGVPLSAPYLVEVSGDPNQIQQAIERKGSHIDTLRRAAKIETLIETVK